MINRLDVHAGKVAVRAAVLMPLTLILAGLLLGEGAKPFAAFGSFVLLTMVTFAGRPISRTFAWLAFALSGCLLVAIGTAASTVPVAAVAVAAVVSFLIFFSGVVNPYVSAAKTGAILLLALPLMVPGEPSDIGLRVAGWLLACAVCIPATYLVWRLPWISDLRAQAGKVCDRLSELVRDPSDPKRTDVAEEAVWGLGRQFTDTANRPTGAAGSSASVAGLVDRLSWFYDLVVLSADDVKSGKRGDELRNRVADLLIACRKVILGEVVELPTAPVEKELERLQRGTNQQVVDFASAGQVDRREALELRSSFRLAKLGWVALEVSSTTGVILERERDRGPLTRFKSWITVWAPQEMKAASRVISEHSALRSTWLRNSLRSAVGITLAVLAAELLAVQNAFWVVLGTLTVLRSDALATRESALRAVVGTIGGIVLGSVLLLAAGTDKTLLWVMFPFAVMFAAYATKAMSFGFIQAGFATMVLVLYNLSAPVGWELGLVRLQDVAIGCGISLLVGFLVWPRGARPLIRKSIADSYRLAAELLADRALHALRGDRDDETGGLERKSSVANARLDAALRQYLDEAGRSAASSEDMVALCAGGFRLARTASEIERIPSSEWFAPSSPRSSEALVGSIRSVTDWYGSAGRLLVEGQSTPKSLSGKDLPDWLFYDEADEPVGATLGRFWIGENFEYLSELSERYVQRSESLRHDRGETG